MARKTFSPTLPDFTEEITNPALRGSLLAIGHHLGLKKIKIKIFAEGYIAVPLNIKVELPPLGNYNQLDIRNVEPIMAVFNLKNYPIVAPKIYTDRLDFPKDKLAHLYVATKKRPPAFCLVRGSMTDWYAGKRPSDLMIRVANWLRDAALGELSENGGQFDPLRMEEYAGQLVYDYDLFADTVIKEEAFIPDGNFAIAIFKRTAANNYKFHQIVNAANAASVDKLLNTAFKKENDSVSTDHYHIGYIVWGDSTVTFDNYQIEAPDNWKDLRSYGMAYGIDLSATDEYIADSDRSHFRGIPVILAIRRPAQVIGFSRSIEFSNHVIIVSSDEKVDHHLVDKVEVSQYIHNQPLTLKLARDISNVITPLTGLNLVAGCGALGSKVVLHLARSGQTTFLLSDPDKLSSHNLVRHALLSNEVGVNKAEALAKEIKEIFPSEALLTIGTTTLPDITLNDELSNVFGWIFDFTASEAFLNTLINAQNLTKPRICKASISDHGNMGIVLFEGVGRNPRLDDLQMSLINAYEEEVWVSNWLKREATLANSGNVSISVGVGCNSETTILPDDKVSAHAAFASSHIKRECGREPGEGKIFINRITDGEFYQVHTETIEVKPFVVFSALNGSGWSIRYKASIIETMKSQMGIKMPNETGGVFIGAVNYKTQTIHVMDIITEPADSTSNDVCFHRGIHGLPEKVKEIHENSGGQLGYIGEWHTHPFGPNALSGKDMQTVKKFKTELDSLENPLPVFLTVVTPDFVLPYVF